MNNIPSLFFLGSLSTLKGKWVKISEKDATSTDELGGYLPLSYLKERVPETEGEYKKKRDQFAKFLRIATVTADEEKLILFKSKPQNDTVDGRKLVRYELTLNKDAIIPFYTKIQSQLDENFSSFVDEGFIDYLKSDEFSQVFDYVNSNTKLTLWTDKEGFPAILEVSLRIVPPDTATQLENKQARLTFRFSAKDINKPIDIEAPSGAMLLDDLMKKFSMGSSKARELGREAAIKAALANIRAGAELVFDKLGGYGEKPFALGPCSKKLGTLFADSQITASLEQVTEKNISQATCVATADATGKVSAYAISTPLIDKAGFSYCVDSKGSAQEILGTITKASCR